MGLIFVAHRPRALLAPFERVFWDEYLARFGEKWFWGSLVFFVSFVSAVEVPLQALNGKKCLPPFAQEVGRKLKHQGGTHVREMRLGLRYLGVEHR